MDIRRPVVPRGTFKVIVVCCLVVCVLLIIAIVLFCSLVLPRREVNYKILSTDPIRDELQLGKWGISIPILVYLSLINMNFYDINVPYFEIQGTHPLYNGVLVNGNLTNIKLPSRTDHIPVTAVAFVKYQFNQDPSRAFLKDLNRNCTDPNGSVEVDLNVNVWYSMFITDGALDMQSTMSFPCTTLTNGMTLPEL
jgi:hypothetical protein